MTAVAPEATLEAPVEVAITGKTPWQLFWTRFKKDKAAFVGAALVGILVLLALTAPLIADYIVGHGPNELFSRRMTDEFGLPKGPNNDFWFGADQAGRDVFVRTIYGAQTSMLVALGATGIAVFFGVVLGMTAGYLGGKTDTFISRVMDVMLSMPVLLFAIGIAAACGADVVGCLGGAIKPGRLLVVLVIALFTWPYIGSRRPALSAQETLGSCSAKSCRTSSLRSSSIRPSSSRTTFSSRPPSRSSASGYRRTLRRGGAYFPTPPASSRLLGGSCSSRVCS
jgi:ABC-type Fe3+ transport system permease subunit